MAPFSIPAPSIIPLRLPIFGGPKSIDTNTKIQLLSETRLEHEIFYTLDGTKPQPYAGIVQGSKTIKYSSPFCLPAGKITIKAVAINTHIHTMCSSIVTKCFEVIKEESENDKSNPKSKQPKSSKSKKKTEIYEKKNLNGKTDIQDEKICDVEVNTFDSDSTKDKTHALTCLEEAFIASSDFDIENSDLEESIEEEKSNFSIDEDTADENDNVEETENSLLHIVEGTSYEKEPLSEAIEKLVVEDKKDVEEDKQNITLTNTGTSVDTQFCCLKCDLTLQQCTSCNKMNAVSSKFCIECGKQLILICAFCKESNPSSATFCQYCGKKLGTRLEPFIKVDHGTMTKPKLKNASIQKLPVMVDKCIQTLSDRSPIKKSFPDVRRMPRHSPGRGYWHQQLDYICNHLKSHAYNNLEFRKEISEPMLCDFKSAHITKSEDIVTVTINFSPFVTDKNGFLEEMKSKEQDSN